MWGFGGRCYWRRLERGKVEGIVVVFAWTSAQEKQLDNYAHLYSFLGWNSLVVRSQFLNIFFPDKAASLALEIVNELVQELKHRPCPIVFSSFSGGPKACMYKVLEIIDVKSGAKNNLDEYQLVRDCVCGHIFDSNPADFVSDIGTRFVFHPAVHGMSHPPAFASWIANGISSCLDVLFLNKFESQHADYWQTLYSTVTMGVPYLILCSEDDSLAPHQVIFNFATRLKDLGGDVNLVKWSTSSHVGHFQHYPEEYKAAVSKLLMKASTIFSQRICQLEENQIGTESSHNDTPNRFSSLRRALQKSSLIPKRIALDLSDHFLMPNSTEYHDDMGVGPILDKQNEHNIPVFRPPKISAHSVLGLFLFDACIPRTVEDWDLKSSHFASAPRQSPFNPVKFIRRSRL